MTTALVIFSIGLTLLLISTHHFLKLAEKLSIAMRISPFIIGVTLVSIGTSLPELAVSSVALIQHDTGLAAGNIIGSNIVNVFLVLGIGILAGKLKVGTLKTQKNVRIMAGTAGLFILLYLTQIPPRVAGFVLLGVAIFVTYQEYLWGVYGRSHEDKKESRKYKVMRFSRNDVATIFVSLVGLILGSYLLVSSVEYFSDLMGFSTTLLGLSVTAIATSLPELLTTLLSEKSHSNKIAIGNLLGSNIYNLALIGGIILYFSSWQAITRGEIVMLSVATIIFAGIVVIYNGKYIPKPVGLVLLGFFIVYLNFL